MHPCRQRPAGLLSKIKHSILTVENWYLYCTVIHSKNGVNLDKSRTVYIGSEKLDILYCQNDINHLPNSAGLCL